MQQTTERPATDAANTLALGLLGALRRAGNDGNTCFSPWSLGIALAMTTEGAQGETAAELKRALGLPDDAPLARAHEAFAALNERLRRGRGDASPETQARIAALREQLDAANHAATGAGDDWRRQSELAEKAQRIAAELNGLLVQTGRYDLRVANAMWVARSFPLRTEFVAAVDRWYGTGGAQSLDIAADPDAARRLINGWIENQTNQRIRDLIPDGALPGDTRLVIGNAVWFLGEWSTPFDRADTRDEAFTRARGGPIDVPLMRDERRDDVRYAAFRGDGSYFATPRMLPARQPGDTQAEVAGYPDANGFTVVELPYKGGEVAMVLLLPRAADGLARVEATLTPALLDACFAKLASRRVDTALPRFELTASIDAVAALKAIGVRRAFVDPALPGGAQFDGMVAGSNPADRLFIGNVLHRAFVQVNEKGTEAAAATAVVMAPTAAAMPPQQPFDPVFRADHPFLWLIRDVKSGAILFVGRVVDPSS